MPTYPVLLPLRGLQAALAIVGVLILSGCTGRTPGVAAAHLTAGAVHRPVDMPESPGLTNTGDLAGTAWSTGTDLEAWYRDLGDSLLVATRSSGTVVIHVDVNRNGAEDGGVDRAYGAGPGSTIHCEYSRPSVAVAAWDEVRTLASATTRNDAGRKVVMWTLPKVELGALQDGAWVTFEIFDERYQTSDFRPASTFESCLRLKYTHSSSEKLPAGPGPLTPPKPSTPGSAGKSSPLGAPKQTPPPPPPAPTIVTFQAEPSAIERGSGTLLKWDVGNASAVRIEPGLGTRTTRGEESVTPNETTSYTLTAEGPGGVASANVTVAVNAVPPPVIGTFQGPIGTIQPESTVSLRWAVTGRVSDVRIEPGLASLPAQGEREVSPSRTTLFTLIAEGPGGRVTSAFTVRVALPPPPGISFEAQPSSVSFGESATLRWNTTGATRTWIEPSIGGVNAFGTTKVKPLAPTTYTLTAQGPGGTASRAVTIGVTRPLALSGTLAWSGEIHGAQFVTILKNRATLGALEGSLPGGPVVILPIEDRRVSIIALPAAENDYERLVLRIVANGRVHLYIRWTVQ